MQSACIKWFDYQYPKISRLLHHSPNGGSRNILEAKKFKYMGVRAGFPDLILLIPRHGFASLCIEMKVGKNKQTQNQKQWQELAESANNKYAVCRSFEEFVKIINDYLK